MSRSTLFRASLAALLATLPACGGGAAPERSAPGAARPDSAASAAAPPVAGRWERVSRPDEWIEFGADGTFRGQSLTGTDVGGRYRQDGARVTLEVLPQGHGATLTLQDTLLVMEEGTRYRRAPR